MIKKKKHILKKKKITKKHFSTTKKHYHEKKSTKTLAGRNVIKHELQCYYRNINMNLICWSPDLAKISEEMKLKFSPSDKFEISQMFNVRINFSSDWSS